MRRNIALLLTLAIVMGFMVYSHDPDLVVPNVSIAPGSELQPAACNLQPSSSSVLTLNAPLVAFQGLDGGELKMTRGIDYDSFCFGADMFELIKLSPEEKRLVNLIKGANDTNLAVAGDLHSVTLKPGQTGYYGVRILPPKRGEVTGVTFILTTVPISGVPDIVNNYFKIKYVESVGGSAGNVKDGTTSGKAYQVISPAGDIWFFFAFTAVVKSGGIRTTIEPHFFGGPHITSVEPQYIQCCCEHVKTPLLKVPEPTICWWYGIPYISDLYVWWYKYALYCKAVKNTNNVSCTHPEATGKDLVIKGDGFNRLRGREADLPTLITITDDCGSVARVTEATIVSDNEIRAKIDITVCRPGQKCVKISGVGGFGTATLLKVVQDVPDTIVTQKRFTAVRIFGTQEKLPLTINIDNGENITFPANQSYNVTCVTRSSGTTVTTTSTGTCNNIATTTIQGTCVPGEDNITVTGPGINCAAPIRNADITLVAVPDGKSAYVCVGELQEVKVTVKSPSTYYSAVTLTSSAADVIRVWADPAKTTQMTLGEPIFDNPVGSTEAIRSFWVEGLTPGTACLIATYCDKSGTKCDSVALTIMEFLALKATDKSNSGNVVEDTTDGTEVTPKISLYADAEGKAKVTLSVTTDPATGDVLQRVKYTVEGATANPPTGAFDPTKPTEVTLTPTGGNRTYTITAWLDCDNDGNRDPEETTRVVEATVIALERLRVADSGNPDLYREDATPAGPDPVLYYCNQGSVKVKLSVAMLPPDEEKAKTLWIVEGNAATLPKGNFATDPEVTLMPADDASRKFTVKAGCDRNGNNTLDPEEVTRAVAVVLEKVELTIPSYIGVGATVDAFLTIAAGDTRGKWMIGYTATEMTVKRNGVVVPLQLSETITSSQTITFQITMLKAGTWTITATFIPEGEDQGCASEKTAEGVKIDVDIDSDNNNYTERTAPFQEEPERSEGKDSEEAIEDSDGYLGKVMGVNDNDDDRDGIRDDIDFANPKERDLIPIIVEIPAPVNIASARINIRTLAEGKIRIWKMTFDRVFREFGPRNPQSVKDGGDRVEPGVYDGVNLMRLGFIADKREVTLYVEGMGSSTGRGAERIIVELDPDGAGETVGYITSDAVRLTIMRPDVDVDTDRDGGTDNDDDANEYTRGYYTWRGDDGGRWRPFDTNIEPLDMESPVNVRLTMSEAPAGGVITVITTAPGGGDPHPLVFNGAGTAFVGPSLAYWRNRALAFWAGDMSVSPNVYTVPGVYRFQFRIAIDNGFSIADEVTIHIIGPRLTIYNGGSDLDNGQSLGRRGIVVPDADKMSIGAHVLVNWDDDNADGQMNADGTWVRLPVPDMEQNPVPNEDNLAFFRPTVHLPFNEGTVSLWMMSGEEHIRLWTTSDKQGEFALPAPRISWDLSREDERSQFEQISRDGLWIEGISPGTPVWFQLQYENRRLQIDLTDNASAKIVMINLGNAVYRDNTIWTQKSRGHAAIVTEFIGPCTRENIYDDNRFLITDMDSYGIANARSLASITRIGEAPKGCYTNRSITYVQRLMRSFRVECGYPQHIVV